MGRNAAVQAARALRLLNSDDLRHHPRTAPAERSTPSTTPGAPLNLGIVDYLTQTRTDVVDHVRAVVPDPTPVPAQVDAIYDWYVEQTAGTDEAEQAYRDTLIARQALEHSVRLGNHTVVCEHPCPRCGRWGLMWDEATGRAFCSHGRCRTPAGLASTWTLGRLAAQQIQRTEIWRRNAT
jgi:hypothetical protein